MEEVISTIRTAQAFGAQTKLEGVYNKFVTGTLTVDFKAARWNGGSFGVFYFIIYASYGLGQLFQPFFCFY